MPKNFNNPSYYITRNVFSGKLKEIIVLVSIVDKYTKSTAFDICNVLTL